MEEERKRFVLERMNNLPKGCVTKRTISGKVYFYYQWVEDGKQYSKVISEDRANELTQQILERRMLAKELKNIANNDIQPSYTATVNTSYVPKVRFSPQFNSNVIYGENLKSCVRSIVGLNKRYLFNDIINYLKDDTDDRVCLIYGIDGSGKTTLFKQIVNSYTEENYSKIAFFSLTSNDSYLTIQEDMNRLISFGVSIFIFDDISLMSDYVQKPYYLYNQYASKGYKILCSGTEILGNLIESDNSASEHTLLFKSSYVSYKESKEVFNIANIKNYIIDFRKNKNLLEYKKSSLLGDNFKLNLIFNDDVIKELCKTLDYSDNEFSNTVFRYFNQINSKCLLDIISNCYNQQSLPNLEVLKKINEAVLVKSKENSLNILDLKLISNAFNQIDFIVDVDIVELDNLNNRHTRSIFTQFDLRYYMLTEFIRSLLLSDKFRGVNIEDRNNIIEFFNTQILGYLVMDLILLETKMSLPNDDVFTLKFVDGKYDMVVSNPTTEKSSIFNIFFEDIVLPIRLKDLNEQKKLFDTEYRYGKVCAKNVLYLGDTKNDDGIDYINIQEYLQDVSLTAEERKIINEFKRVLSKLSKKQ